MQLRNFFEGFALALDSAWVGGRWRIGGEIYAGLTYEDGMEWGK